MAEMKCRLCGEENSKLFYRQGQNSEYKFYLCRNCGLVNYDLSSGLNQEKFTRKYVPVDVLNDKQNRTQAESYRFFRNYIKPPGKILDIGCGNGNLLYLARKDGFEVRGIELSDYFAKEIKDRLSIAVDVANFLEYESEDRFDYIVIRHVLEHLPDSGKALNKINSLLNPGGIVLLEFPNIMGLEFKAKRVMEKTGLHRKKYSRDYKPGHCNEFSIKPFTYLAHATGFELIKWQTYSNKKPGYFLYNYFDIASKARAVIKKVK